jgi:hypothetical protein
MYTFLQRTVLAFSISALAVLAVPARAEPRQEGDKVPEPKAGQGPGKTKTIGNVKPKRGSEAFWRVEGFNRVVRLHQADTTDAGARGLYFHRPLFTFVEAAKPLAGYPAIVHKVKKLPGDAVELTFVVLLTMPEFCRLAEAVVWAQDGEALRAQGLQAEQVKVLPWPITHAVVDCKVGKEVLASAETESLASIDDRIPFKLVLQSDGLDKFLAGVKDDEVTFTFSYTYENRRVAEGTASASVTKSVRAVVDQSLAQNLTPGQRDGTLPIFQQHVNAIERDVRVKVNRVVRAQDKSLLPLLDPATSVVGKLFELSKEPTFEELQGDKDLNQKVYEALKPLIETWSSSKERKKGGSEEKEYKETTKATDNFSLDLKIPIGGANLGVGGGGTDETTRERRNLLKTEYGVTTKEDRGGQFYVPYSIRVYKFNTGKVKAELEESTQIFLAVGESDQYLEDTPVGPGYTAAKLRELVARAGLRKPTRGDRLEDLLADTTAALDKAKDDARNLLPAVNAAKEDVKAHDVESDRLQKKVNEAEAAIAAPKKAIQDIYDEAKRRDAKTDAVGKGIYLATQSKFIEKLKGDVATAEKAHEDWKKELALQKSKRPALEAKVAKAEKSLADADERVRQLEAEQSVLKRLIGEHK